MCRPQAGGARVAVSTNRECAWTANSTASWLTISGTASGQGDGNVEYVAAANSDPTSRRGVIELNDQRANITQAAADCAMQLADPSESFTPAGGSGTIVVRASSGMCTWTAVSDSSWITIRSGASGTGNGTVVYDVAAATGPPRTGTVLAAGLRFAVTQSQSCTYSVAPTSYSPAPGGGSTIVNVSTAAGCPWTAASNVPWATVVQGATGIGTGAAQVVVDGTSGPTRTGSVLVAGQLVAITQGAGCNFSVGSALAFLRGAGRHRNRDDRGRVRVRLDGGRAIRRGSPSQARRPAPEAEEFRSPSRPFPDPRAAGRLPLPASRSPSRSLRAAHSRSARQASSWTRPAVTSQ